MADPGCKDCPDRHVGCHSDCERYLEFRKKLDELREKKRIESEKEYASIPHKNRYAWFMNKAWR